MKIHQALALVNKPYRLGQTFEWPNQEGNSGARNPLEPFSVGRVTGGRFDPHAETGTHRIIDVNRWDYPSNLYLVFPLFSFPFCAYTPIFIQQVSREEYRSILRRFSDLVESTTLDISLGKCIKINQSPIIEILHRSSQLITVASILPGFSSDQTVNFSVFFSVFRLSCHHIKTLKCSVLYSFTISDSLHCRLSDM